jgi:hypothetical protein
MYELALRVKVDVSEPIRFRIIIAYIKMCLSQGKERDARPFALLLQLRYITVKTRRAARNGSPLAFKHSAEWWLTKDEGPTQSRASTGGAVEAARTS